MDRVIRAGGGVWVIVLAVLGASLAELNRSGLAGSPISRSAVAAIAGKLVFGAGGHERLECGLEKREGH